MSFSQIQIFTTAVASLLTVSPFSEPLFSMEDRAPLNQAPKLPFSPIRFAGDIGFVSGMLPYDPANPGKLKEGSIGELTQQIIENIQNLLAQSGLTLDNVVKTQVYLTDIRDFQEMNQAYAEMFANNCEMPARSTFEVKALPLGSRIEIECIVYRGIDSPLVPFQIDVEVER